MALTMAPRPLRPTISATPLPLRVVRASASRWQSLHGLLSQLAALVQANAQIDAATVWGITGVSAMRQAVRAEERTAALEAEIDDERTRLTSELLRVELRVQMKADTEARTRKRGKR